MNQLSIIDLQADNSSTESNISNSDIISSDSFGCCSRYRQCSAEMKCLIADRQYSAHCIYRKQLEAGVSYYGKTASDFVNDDYSRFKNTVSALSADTSAYYHSLLTHFLRTKRGIARELLYKCSQLCELENLGLISITKAHSYVLSRYRIKSLLSLIKHDPDLLAQWQIFSELAKNEAQINGSKYNIRDVFIPWLNKSAPEIIVSLDEKYVFASLPSQIFKYAEEYCIDTSNLPELCTLEFDLPLQSDPMFLGVNTTSGDSISEVSL